MDALNRAFAESKASNQGCPSLNVAQKVADVPQSFQRVGKYFKIRERNSKLTTELTAGLSLFLTIAYILVVNADIIAVTGGPCSVKDCMPDGCSDPQVQNLEDCFGSFFNAITNAIEPRQATVSLGEACKLRDSGYEQCKETVRRDITTATAALGLVFSALMGLCANMPLALAPGMGVNAYFAYSIVGPHGSGTLTYGQALGAVLVSGAISFLLAVVGLRSRIAEYIPTPVRCSTVAGIGLLLVLIGVQDTNGLGLVAYDPDTILALGGCPLQDRAHVAPVRAVNATSGLEIIGPMSTSYMCTGGQLTSATTWLGIVGFLVIALCLRYSLNGAMIYGILLVTAFSWIRDTPATYFPHDPSGDAKYEFFKKVVSFHPIEKTLLQLDFSAVRTSAFWAATSTILYATIIDSTSVIDSMAKLSGLVDQNDETQSKFPRRRWTYCIESLAEGLSSLLGCSPSIVFVESAVGIKEGGRTGVTALTAAVLFGVSLLFTPIFASVPPFAVGAPLIAVGILMMGSASAIDWSNVGEAFPAFATMVMMPYTYSILNGILAGLGLYAVLHGPQFLVDNVRQRWLPKPSLEVESPGPLVVEQPSSPVQDTSRKVSQRRKTVDGNEYQTLGSPR